MNPCSAMKKIQSILQINIDPHRIYGLDILRALAILFVVINHAGHFFPEPYKTINYYLVMDGVSIFFVLSGFLIGGILIKQLEQKPIGLKMLFQFWIRRWFRTLPTYFLVLITLCLFLSLTHDDFELKSVQSYFYFSQNFAKPHPSFFPEAWSLSIEEWFYLIVPIILVIIIAASHIQPKQAVLTTLILIIISVLALRYYRHTHLLIPNDYDIWDITFRKQVVTRLDSLMYGVLGASIQYYYLSFWQKYKNIFFLLGITILLFSKYLAPQIFAINSLYSTVFSFCMISTGTLALLPLLSHLKTGRGAIYQALTYLSIISYSMYLINLSLMFRLINNLPWRLILDNPNLTTLAKYILYWIILIPSSILLYKYFESPMTNLRDKIKI